LFVYFVLTTLAFDGVQVALPWCKIITGKALNIELHTYLF